MAKDKHIIEYQSTMPRGLKRLVSAVKEQYQSLEA
jgi:hypothetical protein